MLGNNIKPLVGVISDLQIIGPHPFHVAGDKYLRALVDAANVAPVIIPCLHPALDVDDWLTHLDGVFLTGAYSMVDPALYGEGPLDRDYSFDSERDRQSRALIAGVLRRRLPLLGACRGLQDINVALGGSLHQAVHEVAGLDDHREDKVVPLAEQYAEVHDVQVVSGGLLHRITGRERFLVNSLHSQGINRLGQGLTAQAFADDGLIEAVSIDALDFGPAVQWHPECQVRQHPIQCSIFEAFGDACRAR